MIATDEVLHPAQEPVSNLQRILIAARTAHAPAEYRAMSAPILLEIQRREQEILAYLSRAETEPIQSPR